MLRPGEDEYLTLLQNALVIPVGERKVVAAHEWVWAPDLGQLRYICPWSCLCSPLSQVLQAVDNERISKTLAFPEASFPCFKAALGQSDSVSSHFPLLLSWCLEGRLLFLQKQLPGSLFLSSTVDRGLQKDRMTWRPVWRFDSINWPHTYRPGKDFRCLWITSCTTKWKL